MQTLSSRIRHIFILTVVAFLAMAQAELSEECQKRLEVILSTNAVSVAQGADATIVVRTNNFPDDAGAFTLRYGVSGLPANTNFTVDYSIQGLSDRDAALVTISPGLNAPPGTYDATVYIAGQVFDGGKLAVTIQPATQIAEEAKAIAAGEYHTLVVLSHFLSDVVSDFNEVWAVGENFFGQLGNGTRLDSPFILGRVGSLSNIVDVAAGENMSVALDSKGNVWAWGFNLRNKDTQNPINDIGLMPVQVPGFGDLQLIKEDEVFPPVEIEAIDTGGSVFADDAESLALDENGNVWQWFGLNSNVHKVEGLSNITHIEAGKEEFFLALDGDGDVWGWGFNRFGRLGLGEVFEVETPAKISALDNVTITAIAAGHSHSLAVDSNGKVWSWGANHLGELGIGPPVEVDIDNDGDTDFDRRETPVQVLGLEGVTITDVAAGADHSVALDTDGNVWVWGAHLGDGTHNTSGFPVQVPDLTNISSIDASRGHSLALNGQCGTVWEWGTKFVKSETSILGNANRDTVNYLFPVPLPGIGGWNSCGEVLLTVTIAGTGTGTVSSNSSNFKCSPDEPAQICFEVFDEEASVTLTAEPADGSSFDKWVGNCSGSDPVATVFPFREGISCVAVFQTALPKLMEVHVRGPGSVVSDPRPPESIFDDPEPPQIQCEPDCSEVADETSYTLNAIIDPPFAVGDPPNVNFLGWGSDCVSEGTNLRITVIMDDHKRCTADFEYIMHTLTVGKIGNGTVTTSPSGIHCGSDCDEDYIQGETISVTATPDLGWGLQAWEGDCSIHGFGSPETITFQITADTSCTPRFVRTGNILRIHHSVMHQGRVRSFSGDIDCGNSTVNGVVERGRDCEAAFDFGINTVSLIVEPNERFEFLDFFGDCSRQARNDDLIVSIVVMNGDRVCGVSFANELATIADFSFFPNQPVIGERVTFDTRTTSFNIFGVPRDGSFVYDRVTGTYDYNAIATYEWDFDDDGTFDLRGGRSQAQITHFTYNTPGQKTVRLRVVPFNSRAEPRETTWTFDVTNPVLRVLKRGTGTGRVDNQPWVGIFCGNLCGNEFPNGAQVILTARPDAGSFFAGWGGSGVNDDCGSNWQNVPDPAGGPNLGVTTVDLSLADGTRKTCMAYFISTSVPHPGFQRLTYIIDTQNSTGTGTIGTRPGGRWCGTNCGDHLRDTRVFLDAVPDRGSVFDGWFDGAGNPCGDSVLMNTNHHCRARFSLEQGASMLTTSVNTTGNSGGTITGVGIDCGNDCEERFTRFTFVTLQATPDTGSFFVDWTGNSVRCSGTDPIIEVNISADIDCEANFSDQMPAPITLADATLEVLRAGQGTGTVTGNGFDCGNDCTETYPSADASGNLLLPVDVTLTAAPDSGSAFGGWIGCNQVSGADCTVTVTNSGNVTAFFNVIVQRQAPGVIITDGDLDVTVGGTGTGNVVSNPAGINCGTDCTENYAVNEVITLTPNSTGGSIFAGWQGDADCSDGIVTINGDVSCTAIFNFQTATLTTSIEGAGNGTVVSNPTGISCESDCDEDYVVGTTVTLTANPAPSSSFVEWTGLGSDIAITRMEATPDTLIMGGNVIYDIQVTNNGPQVAEDVRLFTLNSSISAISGQALGQTFAATLVSASQGCSQPNGTGNPLECNLGDIPAGNSVGITMVVTPTATAFPLRNSARVFAGSALTGNDPDTDPSNNVAFADVDVLPTTGIDLAITRMEATPSTVTLGDNIIYEIEVTNQGAQTATGVILNTLARGLSVSGQPLGSPLDVTLVSASTGCSQPNGTGNPVQCTLGNLASGSSATVTVEVNPNSATLPRNFGQLPLTNSARVLVSSAISGPSPDINPANDVATVGAEVMAQSSVDLAITRMEALPDPVVLGGNITYAIEVTNLGDATAVDATLMTLANGFSTLSVGQPFGAPPDVTFVSASSTCTPPNNQGNPMECNLGNLAAGAKVTVNVTVTPNAATLPHALGLPQLTNSASVFVNAALTGADPDVRLSNNVASVGSDVLPTDCYGTNPTTQVSLDGDRTCIANFDFSGFELTVSRTGNGDGTVTSDIAGIDCGSDCDEIYGVGVTVVLTAIRASGSRFDSWTGCDTTVSTTCTVTIDGLENVTARFTRRTGGGGGSSSGGSSAPPPTVFTLTTTIVGNGTATSTPSGIDCPGSCNGTFASGTEVTLTATPEPGESFISWAGCNTASSTECIVNLTSNRSVTATFTSTVSFTLDVTVVGNGVASSTPAGIDCGVDCSESYTDGTDVTVTAIPDAGAVFISWTGDCDSISGNDCDVNVDDDKSVTANFGHTLDVSKAGSGDGTVTSDVGSINCGSTCDDDYIEGTIVTLTATPDGSSTFAGWTGDADCADGIVTLSVNVNCTANFDTTTPGFTLTIVVSGTNTGTVTATGISCDSPAPGVGDCSESYSPGTMVTITATQVSGFAILLGDCSGFGGDDPVTPAVDTITMDSDKTCTANFTDG